MLRISVSPSRQKTETDGTSRASTSPTTQASPPAGPSRDASGIHPSVRKNTGALPQKEKQIRPRQPQKVGLELAARFARSGTISADLAGEPEARGVLAAHQKPDFYFSKKPDPALYGGEFNGASLDYSKLFGLDLNDPVLSVIAYSDQEKKDRALVIDSGGRARLANGESVQGKELRFSMDPSTGDFIVLPDLIGYRVQTRPDGGIDRSAIKSEDEFLEAINNYKAGNAEEGFRLEMYAHSTALGGAPSQGDGGAPEDALGRPLREARSSALAGIFRFDEASRLTAVTSSSGHHRHGPEYLVQGLEQLARKGALFDNATVDFEGHAGNPVDHLLRLAVEEPAPASGETHPVDPEAHTAAKDLVFRHGLAPNRKLRSDIDIEFYAKGGKAEMDLDDFLATGGGQIAQARRKHALLAELRDKQLFSRLQGSRLEGHPLLSEKTHARNTVELTARGRGELSAEDRIHGTAQKVGAYLALVGHQHDSLPLLKNRLLTYALHCFARDGERSWRGIDAVRGMLTVHHALPSKAADSVGFAEEESPVMSSSAHDTDAQGRKVVYKLKYEKGRRIDQIDGQVVHVCSDADLMKALTTSAGAEKWKLFRLQDDHLVAHHLKTLERQGRLEEAGELARFMVNGYRRMSGVDPSRDDGRLSGLSRWWIRQARIDGSLGRPEAAMQHGAEALTLLKALYPTEEDRYAHDYLDGVFQHAIDLVNGERLDEANALADEMIHLCVSEGVSDRRAKTHAQIMKIKAGSGRLEEAEAFGLKAVADDMREIELLVHSDEEEQALTSRFAKVDATLRELVDIQAKLRQGQ